MLKITNDLSKYRDIMTIDDLREYLNISRNTAYSFLKNNNIKYTRVGRVYIISKKSLAECLGVSDGSGQITN